MSDDKKIIMGSKYGDARKQASNETPHGLTPNTIEQLSERFEQFLPGLSSEHGVASKQFFDGILPDGATMDPRAGKLQKRANVPAGATFTGGGGGNTSISPQRPYQPEFETCTEDTLVLMADGSYKEIRDVKIGDKVINKDGFIEEVIRTRHMGVPDELMEIKTWGGKTLYATDWHKWPVWAWVHNCLCGCGQEVKPGRCFVVGHYKQSDIKSGFKVIDGGAKPYRQRRIPNDYEPFQKLRSDEIKIGDFLVIPRKFDPVEPNITLDQARLLGYYIAEGSITSDTLELTFGLKELDTWVNDASSILTKLGVNNDTSCYEDRNVARLRTKSGSKEQTSKLLYWLEQNGDRGCYNKKLSGDVLRWPIKYKIELLRGALRSDGSQVYAESTKNGYLGRQFQVTYYSASKTLSYQLQIILAQLGIPARIQYIKPGKGKSKDGKVFNRNEGWRLVISNDSARRLSYLIWGDLSKSEDKKWSSRERCMVDDQYVYVPVTSVKLVKNTEKKAVINITVTGDRSYTVENIGTYNSPDRQMYPVHRILANRYWRLFYKLDPVIGNCLDMYKTMPWSDFQLSGEGITGEIKETLETMCRETNVLSILEHMVGEFLAIGECVPHCFFDDAKGIWSYIALHNPDQLEVIDAPFIKMEPIVEFIPDDRLRAVLTSSNHLLRQIREQMPPELISRLIARQNIPLSPINMTFIPRRMHPYDTRGTSIISRMWRILMYEDCFVPGTEITRPDGSTTFIEDLLEGDIILDKNGNRQEILRHVEKESEYLIGIKTQGGWNVECTPSHNWPIVKKEDAPSPETFNQHVDNINKIQASDLRVGDYLLIPRDFEKSIIDDISNASSARLLGYYTAEGSRATFNKDGYGVAWSYNINELDTWAKDTVDLCKELNCDTKVYTRKSGCQVRSHKKENVWLADWLFQNGGELSHAKRLSEMVMGWPIELKQEFIKGYFRGDGSYSALHKKHQESNITLSNCRWVRASTTSKQLANQIQLILAQLGIFSKVRDYQHPCSDGKCRRRNYFIEAGSHFGDQLAALVWGDSVVPKRKIKDYRSNSNVIVAHDYLLVPIIEISKKEYNDVVYGITVSGDHSYLVNNIGTYNSVYNASIATARRHAGPIKVAKLGNPQTGWIPSQEHERRLLSLLAQAELDVNAWLVYHYGINFEMVGTTDRIINISQHHEVIERIKLIAMGISKCFTYGTLINLADGTYKEIQDVKIGDRVIDKDGKIETVVDAWEEGIPEQVVELTLKGGKKFTITENHKFPVWAWPRECACGCGERLNKQGNIYNHGHFDPGNNIETTHVNEFTTGRKSKRIPTDYNPLQVLKAIDLEKGDCLLIPRKFEEVQPDIKPLQARLLGYYVSEGHIIKGEEFGGKAHGDGFEFSLNANESETLAIDIKNICAELGIDMYTRSATHKSGIKVTTQAKNSIHIARWLRDHGGEYASTKMLSEEVMRWPLEYKRELIRGLYRGDGCQYWSDTVKKNNGKFSRTFNVRYATTSHVLARQIQLILAQLGFYASLDKKKPTGWGKLPQLNPKTRGYHARKLADLIWEENSQSNQYEHDSPINNFRVDDEYIYLPITKIKIKKNIRPVFNLSVSGSHSYLANNCASMNSFLHGEVTYASSYTGLSVFLQRMKSIRSFFVNTWLIPKFFKPIARINGWVKRDQKEINFRYRVKRSQREIERENRWIVPRIEWEKQLDHTINNEMVTAMNALENNLGVKFSKTTKYAAVGRKFEEEVHKIKEEQKYEQELNEYMPAKDLAGGPAGGPQPPIGGGGLPPTPPRPAGPPGSSPSGTTPPGSPQPGMGTGGPSSPTGIAPGGAPGTTVSPGGIAEVDKGADSGGTGPSGKRDPAVRDTDSSLWDHKGRYGNWSASEITELVSLLKDGKTDSPLWGAIDPERLRSAINASDAWEVLDVIEDHLQMEGYPPSDIKQLRRILDSEGVLKDIASGDTTPLKKVEDNLGDSLDALNDQEAMDRVSTHINGERPDPVKMSDPDMLLVGHGNEHGVWSGDISDLIK